MSPPTSPAWRTLFVLGRASNLPTVWTNCLAGWWLGGGGPTWDIVRLCVGASLLYVGGMYLNDAFDAEFDRQYRRERPIPAGLIREDRVWQIGASLLAAGAVLLISLGWITAIFAAFLVGAIVLYDALHKALALSPLLMAACRFLLYPLASSAAEQGVTGRSIWSGIALAGWIVGLSYVAKRESTTGRFQRWPLLVLALPLFFAALSNNGPWRLYGLGVGFLVAAWAVWCLRHTLVEGGRNLGLTVSGLLAGICLVDWLAVLPPWTGSAVFLGCFVASLLAQRFVPAT
ncbi:MAG TPA: UbiA family prenyltransferase [Verrucomicrobiota bacterium]|nr:prenyltransferase [Verrucomicrobiales bacterium]HRI13750.1 UbiA family prenyltransferase [Verrucomicrobiota bacterium]